MSVVDAVDIPFLRLSDPSFSIRSPEVREARERSWYARTPYGIAVLRYDDVGKLLRDPRLRQGSYAWPAHNKVTGKFADHIIAFARGLGTEVAITVVPRIASSLLVQREINFRPDAWDGTVLMLDGNHGAKSIFDGQVFDHPRVNVAQLFAHLPVALLVQCTDE